MRILFLSHYFPPEVNAPATRTYEHCKYWVEAGNEVTVISCVPHHPMGRVYPGYKNKIFQVEYVDGIRVIRVLTYVTANRGLVKRTLNYLVYMVNAIITSCFAGKQDIVLSTSPQFFNGLAGYFVSRMKRAPWVLEIRDLWPESIVAVGALKDSPTVMQILRRMERFAYKHANLIVSVTNSFVEHIKHYGGVMTPTVVITNGVDLKKFIPSSDATSPVPYLDLEDKFIASYVGTHGLAHGLDVLIDAAELLKANKKIVILTAGDGAELESMREQVNRRQLSNLVMLGQLPKSAMPQLWTASNVSLVLLRKLELFQSVIPSKIFESMAMEKPIILAVEGESSEIIRDADCGICVQPGNPKELADAILILYENKDLYSKYARNGRTVVREKFQRKHLAAEMLHEMTLLMQD